MGRHLIIEVWNDNEPRTTKIWLDITRVRAESIMEHNADVYKYQYFAPSYPNDDTELVLAIARARDEGHTIIFEK